MTEHPGEPQLHETGRYLRDVLESTGDGILVVDRDGRVALSNRRFAELWRIPDELLATRDDARLLQFVLGQLRDPDAFLATVERLYQSTEDSLDQLAFVDGRVFERFSAPLMRDGELDGRVWSFRDITERVRAERALRESEARFRTLYNQTPVMLHSVDRDGRIVEVSDYWLEAMGYARDEVLGRPAIDFVSPECRDRLRVEAAVDLPCRFVRRDGEHFDALLTAVALPDAHGALDRCVTVVVDISALKRAEEEALRLESQVRHAQKLESLGVLAGGIAHDFNNLLVAILGNADLARHMLLGEGHRAIRHIEGVLTGAERAADLCRQMLAYSGKGTFVARPVALSAIAAEMADLVSASLSPRIALRRELPDDLPAVVGDPTQLGQVVLNLLTNAAEGVGESGAIALRTGVTDCDAALLASTYCDDGLEPGRFVFVEVRDDGRGMDAAQQLTIFDPFVTSKAAGRGLGLAVTLGIVRGHRGGIEVASAPGEGACFRVYLPATDEAPDDAPSDSGGYRPLGGTVLVVDDEEQVRDVARAMLEEAGMRVLTAENGAVALGIVRERDDVDLVLLDLTMPVLDGEETLAALREIAPGLPVLLSSGFDAHAKAPRSDVAGVGFIQKPYRAKALQQAVEQLTRDSG